jgi:hypothetical protein
VRRNGMDAGFIVDKQLLYCTDLRKRGSVETDGLDEGSLISVSPFEILVLSIRVLIALRRVREEQQQNYKEIFE